MEGKNVLLAIILSSVVLISWSIFFEQPVVEKKIVNNQISDTNNKDQSTPTIEENKKLNETTRVDAINSVDRIKVENINIKGSISLKGGVIDDIIFKNYNQKLNGEDKVTFLNPKNTENI